MSRCLVAAALLAGCSAWADLHGCFAAPTMIASPTGPRRICDLAVGDEVWSFDPMTSRLAIVAVQAIHRTRGRIHTVRTSRGAIAAVTATHPLYVATRSTFAPAASLTSNDRLLYWNGDHPVAADIIDVVAPIGDDTVDVFNLTVGGARTFFADGHLVHNKDPGAPCGQPYEVEALAEVCIGETKTIEVRDSCFSRVARERIALKLTRPLVGSVDGASLTGTNEGPTDIVVSVDGNAVRSFALKVVRCATDAGAD